MIINQPYDNQLGVDIIRQLQSDEYDTITIMVAYVMESKLLCKVEPTLY